MIVLGIVLLVLGIVIGFHILFILGIALLIIGIILACLGNGGMQIGPRRHYW
jgi:hypothetical protein